jgi:hypothetical protein
LSQLKTGIVGHVNNGEEIGSFYPKNSQRLEKKVTSFVKCRQAFDEGDKIRLSG